MKFSVSAFIMTAFTAGVLCGQEGRPYGATELAVALRKLNVLGSALYVGAHPDDENTAVIATLARGRLFRTAYLSMTRGEGGQNLIGSEKGDMLGVIRTQELLAARRIDGGEQFFTRAIDFGYSKNSEETIEVWERERIVGDIVWVIRSFRPDVIMTRFADTLGGHGNHTASAILTREAFAAAGDPTMYPEQLDRVAPWQPKRLVFNVFRFGRGDGMAPTEKGVALDIGAYDPVLGESFSEISGRSRSMHKSQGFGASQYRGTSLQYFEPTAGEPAKADLFDGIDTGWSRVKGGEAVGIVLDHAYRSFDVRKPWEVIPFLVDAFRKMNELPPDPWVARKKKEIVDVILGCSGVWVDATSSDYQVSPGGSIKVTVSALNRSPVPIKLQKIKVSYGPDTLVSASLPFNVPLEIPFAIRLPKIIKYSEPYWLEKPKKKGSYVIDDLDMIGMPENPPALNVQTLLSVGGESFSVEVPVRYRWVDPVDGEKTRPLVVVPDVAVNVTEDMYMFPDGTEKEVQVTLQNSRSLKRGTVGLVAPPFWNVVPSSMPFELNETRDELAIRFKVRPGDGAQSGIFKVVVQAGGGEMSHGKSVVHYSHFPDQTVFPAAEGKLVRMNVKRTSKNIGYIEGSGDDIPAVLRQIGYDVTFLSDDDLEFTDLSSYDAIIAGVRAYNTRTKLRIHQERLTQYVKNGGTYLVQYVTSQRSEAEDLGPYPFHVSRNRVTVEEAPVRFNDPNHVLLNIPNKITEEDFLGWVQERGLYFADTWDDRYETVLESRDPGEPSQRGGLLYARYGKGVYIYTGYAFFRQLPAGVTGACRLFVNLLSGGK